MPHHCHQLHSNEHLPITETDAAGDPQRPSMMISALSVRRAPEKIGSLERIPLLNKRHVFWLLCVVGAVALAAYGTYAKVSNAVLPSRNVLRPSSPSTAALTRTGPSLSQSSRPALTTYKQTIRDSMFAAPQPTNHAPPPDKPAPPSPAPPVPSVSPTDPLTDALYAGSVTVNGKTMALIENRSTKEGVYVDVGGEWQGYRIVAVSADEISLSVSGTIRRLSKSDANNVVPLSAGAPGSTSTGGRTGASSGSGGGTSPESVLTMRNEVHF